MCYICPSISPLSWLTHSHLISYALLSTKEVLSALCRVLRLWCSEHLHATLYYYVNKQETFGGGWCWVCTLETISSSIQ